MIVVVMSAVSGRDLPIWYGDLISKYWWFDFVVHIGAFYLLTLIVYYPFSRFGVRDVFTVLITIGILLEVFQHFFIEKRYFSIKDILGNWLGVFFGWVTVFLLSKLSKHN